jgi:hypothetical protein
VGVITGQDTSAVDGRAHVHELLGGSGMTEVHVPEKQHLCLRIGAKLTPNCRRAGAVDGESQPVRFRLVRKSFRFKIINNFAKTANQTLFSSAKSTHSQKQLIQGLEQLLRMDQALHPIYSNKRPDARVTLDIRVYYR